MWITSIKFLNYLPNLLALQDMILNYMGIEENVDLSFFSDRLSKSNLKILVG